jgi:hypothetical protein
MTVTTTIFRHGSRIPRCFVCLTEWERLSTKRIRRGSALQEYSCRWCGVEVTVGTAVLTARPLPRRTWGHAYDYLEKAIQTVLSGTRDHYRLGGHRDGDYDGVH